MQQESNNCSPASSLARPDSLRFPHIPEIEIGAFVASSSNNSSNCYPEFPVMPGRTHSSGRGYISL